MSIVTLNKFLLGGRRESEANVPEQPLHNYLDLASRTLLAIRRSVLCGEPLADLAQELDTVQKELSAATGAEDADKSATCIEVALATYKRRVREADSARAIEFRNVLEMLNEALSHLNAGSEKTEANRNKLEGELSLATRIDDISALRAHLSKVLHSVRDEGRRDREKSQKVIDTLGSQIQQANKAHARFCVSSPGRLDAVEYLRPLWQGSGTDLQIAIFAADSLQLIRERHGEDVANLILQDLGQKHITPLFPDGKVFGWSPNSLLLVGRRADPSTASNGPPPRLKSPIEQRAFVGTRVAIFNVAVRSLVMQSLGSLDELTTTLDRFARGA